jgi:haloalkane dehalogenase
MQTVRTPDDRFADLPDFAFAPHHAEVPAGGDDPEQRLRMAYIDEGPADPSAATETVLCLHGEPSWSFLYRHLIPPLRAAGHRVVAPDLVVSAVCKPVERATTPTSATSSGWPGRASTHRHHAGTRLGLLLAGRAEHPERFDRPSANTFLPTGDRTPARVPAGAVRRPSRLGRVHQPAP